MITKSHKGDLGLGLLEKNKKKKKVAVKEPETQYSVLNNNSYFSEVCPLRATSTLKNVTRGQTPDTTPVKKKKKKKKKKGHSPLCEEHLDPETTPRARGTEKPPSPRTQARGPSEFLGGEKKKKRKSLCPLATSPGLRMKTSPDPRHSEEVTRVGKKLKKHKKEKKAREATAFSVRDPGFCEASDAGHTCPVGKGGQEQVAVGRKRKQESPRERTKKVKKRKELEEEGDAPLGHPRPSRAVEGSQRKGRKKKPGKAEASECIPVGDGTKAPAKKKVKSSKKEERPDMEESAPKKKKKKRKESRGAGEPWEEEPDTDLEVVLEKKGNMDETHIDQVRRKALQEEIDRESGKTEAAQARKWTGTQFGQWDTASFENEEQKLKFLKLMGGFKNRPPSFSCAPDATGRPNMALSRRAADRLQQSLQQDYDRAQGWKSSRRAGLGFPTANKVFYIDRSASKSVKFED
ncbi:lysine-rich nucleolar protein 1 [Saccopteryx bilineata]|uniref:lysine-rich nucleolar protein 1 n=1 Tax=Saccopteryx bilineata TaxID=59482 RepID=UPI00338FD74B